MNINKIIINIYKKFILNIMYVNVKFYMKIYVKYLKRRGIIFEGTPNYISNDVYFDSSDYSKISIGDGVTISREVMFLTHDYSLYTVGKNLADIDWAEISKHKKSVYFIDSIEVGNNTFIGARVSLLPGTKIGKNVLIGASSVVKGIIPDYSIVIGNPCKIIGNTIELTRKKINQAENDIRR